MILLPWWSLLSGIALLVCLGLAVLVVRRNPGSLLNWSCAAFQLALALWAFEDVFHGSPLLAEPYVRLFTAIGTIGRVAVPSLFLWFALVLAERYEVLRRWWLYVALIGTPLGFALGLWTGAFPALVRHESFGWVVIWPWSGWSVSFYAYLVSFLFIACVVLVRLWHESQGWRERRRILLVWTTVGATLALGSLTDILLPALNAFGVPELASSFSLVWAVGLYLSVTRYGLMSPATQAAAATTLETMADAVVLMTVEGVVDAVNPVFEALTGRPPAGVVGRPAADLFTRPDLASEEITETRLSSRLRTFRLDCRTETGTGLPVSVSARTTRVGNRSAGQVWVLRDLRDRQESERARRASEESYQSFVENFTGIAFEGGLDFSITFLHGAVRDVTGYEPADFRSGRVRWRDIIHPDDVARLRPGTEQLRTVPGSSLVREYRIRRHDGSLGWVQERIWNVAGPDRRPARLYGTIADVTEQHRAHAELAELSRFRQSIIDSLSILIAVADTEMNVLVWNRAAEEITGYRRDDVIGRHDVWSRLFADEAVRRRLHADGREAMLAGRDLEDIDAAVTRPDGTTRDVRWAFRPVVGAEHLLVNFIMLGQDITDLRRAQSEQARHAHSMALLSQTATELIDLAPDTDVHRFIAERLRQFCGAAAAFVNTYDDERRALTLRAAAGLDNRVTQVLGRSFEGMELAVPDRARGSLLDAGLTRQADGLCELVFGSLPEVICRSVEQLYDLGQTYSMGLVCHGELFGSVAVLMPAGQDLEDPAATEALVRQAAIALRRRAVEDALRESEAEFRAIAESARDGIAILDERSCYVYANPVAAEMLGAPLSEVIGSHFSRWVRPEERQPLAEQAGRRLRGEPAPQRYEVTGVRADGRETKVEVVATPLRWHERPATLVAVRDISERLEHEAELHEARALYERLVATLPYSVTVVNLEGRIVWASAATAERFGVNDPARMLGTHVSDMVAPEERDRARRLLAEVARGSDMRDVRFTIVRPDHGRYPAQVSATLVRDAQGRPMSILAAVRVAGPEQPA